MSAYSGFWIDPDLEQFIGLIIEDLTLKGKPPTIGREPSRDRSQ